MAFTVARYMLQASNGLPEESGLNCANLKVDRPLIASSDSSSQLLRVLASADWHLGEVSLTLFSVSNESQKIADHANCTVKITRAPPVLWRQDWSGLNHLIQGRISSLRKSVDEGDSHKLKRGLTYKLFGSLVEYANEYQGMQEVIFSSEALEATAQVNFQTDAGGFSWNPCWIDSLGHIAGFIMNSTDSEHSKDHVFVNHGWNGMRCAEKIERNKTYQTYNKMIPRDEQGSMYSGDTYILEDGVIVAIFEGVKVRFQSLYSRCDIIFENFILVSTCSSRYSRPPSSVKQGSEDHCSPANPLAKEIDSSSQRQNWKTQFDSCAGEDRKFYDQRPKSNNCARGWHC